MSVTEAVDILTEIKMEIKKLLGARDWLLAVCPADLHWWNFWGKRCLVCERKVGGVYILLKIATPALHGGTRIIHEALCLNRKECQAYLPNKFRAVGFVPGEKKEKN